MEIKHVVFNPQNALMFDGGPLNSILEREEKNGWVLERVVPYHQYESIAVFTREGPEATSVDAGDRLVDAAFEVMDKTLNPTWVTELANNAIKSWKAAQRSKKNA